MKNLENLGVQEMNAQEVKQVEGGSLGAFIAFAYLMDVATNFEQHRAAFMEGYNRARN